MTTIRLTEEENNKLNDSPFIDFNKEWKFIKPYFYKNKMGYYEIYNQEEYKNETKEK